VPASPQSSPWSTYRTDAVEVAVVVVGDSRWCFFQVSTLRRKIRAVSRSGRRGQRRAGRRPVGVGGSRRLHELISTDRGWCWVRMRLAAQRLKWRGRPVPAVYAAVRLRLILVPLSGFRCASQDAVCLAGINPGGGSGCRWLCATAESSEGCGNSWPKLSMAG
jgi:hypothetical protein